MQERRIHAVNAYITPSVKGRMRTMKAAYNMTTQHFMEFLLTEQWYYYTNGKTRERYEQQAEHETLSRDAFRAAAWLHLNPCPPLPVVHAKLMAVRQAWLASGPKCTWCREPITYIPKTGPLPEKCSKKCRAAARAKEKLDERRARGLCQDGCGSPRTPGSARCDDCLVKQREYHRQRRDKLHAPSTA